MEAKKERDETLIAIPLWLMNEILLNYRRWCGEEMVSRLKAELRRIE